MRKVLLAASAVAIFGAAIFPAGTATPVLANGTDALGPPANGVVLATGTGMMSAGIGLIDVAQPASFSFDVPGKVKQALLYWECHYKSGVGDSSIRVNNVSVTGPTIGGPKVFFGKTKFRAWRRDITNLGLITEGSNTLSVKGFACPDGVLRGTDGVGVVVIYEKAGEPTATLGLRDGLDLAFDGFSGSLKTTVPQTFNFAAASLPRQATLVTLVGSVQGPASNFGIPRPNFYRASFDVGASVVYSYPWSASAGNEFDAVDLPVTIPAGATSITVEAISAPDPAFPDRRPASLAWIAAGLSISPVVDTPDPDIDIRKQAEGPDSRTVTSGSDVTFTIVVTNTGPTDLTDVVVTDAQAPDCARNIGDLAAGASTNYTCTLNDVTANLTNTACTQGTHNTITVEDCDPSTVDVIDIDIRKQAEGPDSRTVTSGSDVTFTIVVTNTGPTDLTDVVVTDAQAPDCARNIGDLAAGASTNYTCTLNDVTANLTNTACTQGTHNTITVEDCDPSTVEVISPAAAFLIIDEDSIDNGNPPNFFSDSDVNDDIAEIGLRDTLRYFRDNIGVQITLHTGQVGDEGWFAPEFIPPSWATAGPTTDGLQNLLQAGPGLGTPDGGGDRETLLDKIPDVNPLRADGLKLLEGKTVCALVWDSDISINYGPLNGSLKGANLGIAAFTVLEVTQLFGYSSSTLPKVLIRIEDAATACANVQLFTDAPFPDSSSEPFDIVP